MVETTARMDEKGRIRIPKKIREAAHLKEGSCVHIKTKEKAVIIELAEPVANKYYGIVKVKKWPEDLDEYAAETVHKLWKQRDT